MAIGSILGSVAGGLASAGATKLAGSLFGSDSSSDVANKAFDGANRIQAPPITAGRIDTGANKTASFASDVFSLGQPGADYPLLAQQTTTRTPGLRIDRNRQGGVFMTRNPQLQGLMSGLRSGTDDTVGGLTGLLQQVEPGFGRLTDARVQAVETARQRAAGDLRENLARRRVAGSSFANDAAARQEREFGDAEAAVRAQSFLEELEASRQLMDQIFNTRHQAVQTELGQFQFESGLGAELAAKSWQQLEDARALLGQLQMQQARIQADMAISQGRLDTDASIANSTNAVNAALGGARIGLGATELAANQDAAAGATFGQVLQPAISSIGTGVQNFLSGLFQPQQPATPPLPQPKPA